ncbi:type II secretion system F family protein [Candidatus Bathyarchaeota archaeon]|nr:type II secretion system F family protein [Candidatus Bathyarchaeota archaeon]MBS7635858.1 type II secretion system F family protein [Candidatus Bathyarchaeota archaeon]
MLKIRKSAKQIAWVSSFVLAISIMAFGFFTVWGTTVFDEFMFFAAIVAFTPPTIINYIDYKWKREIDEHLPDLFRSIVQAQETGMTLPRALEEAAKRDFGPLTVELRKMNTQISWGMTLDEALIAFAKRVNTFLVQRTIPLIIEANRSGGHVERVFDPMGKFVQSTLILHKERRNRTRPYIAIIYVAFFVFLFTIVLLFKSFFVEIKGLSMLGTAVMASAEIKRLFFHMTAIQGFFGGLVAGKMGEGAISAGLKHSLVMMICGYLAIKLFL